MTEIRGEAFRNCESLTEINLPETLELIGYDSFRHCSGIKEIVIPEKTSKLYDAFCDNPQIKIIYKGKTYDHNSICTFYYDEGGLFGFMD